MNWFKKNLKQKKNWTTTYTFFSGTCCTSKKNLQVLLFWFEVHWEQHYYMCTVTHFIDVPWWLKSTLEFAKSPHLHFIFFFICHLCYFSFWMFHFSCPTLANFILYFLHIINFLPFNVLCHLLFFSFFGPLKTLIILFIICSICNHYLLTLLIIKYFSLEC